MLLRTFVLICLVSWSIASDAEDLSKASNKFSADLYQKTVESKSGNIVISPVSLQTALSLALFGSTGETNSEIKNALNLNSMENFNILKSSSGFTRSLNRNELKIANKFYVHNKFSIKPLYKEIAVQHFNSDVETIDFTDKQSAVKNINDWVKSKTNGKIENLVDADSLDVDTVLSILNAVHFKAEWSKRFDPRHTIKGQFYLDDTNSEEVEYMNHKKYYDFGEFKEHKFTALKLPYKNSDMYMMIILPDSNTGLSEIEKKLDQLDLNEISSKMTDQKVIVEIPKFRIDFEQEMIDVLKKLGLKKMFTSKAGFPSLINEKVPLQVSSVFHKTFIR